MYRLGGVDKKKGFLCGREGAAHRIEWDGRSWHDRVTEACLAKQLPAKVGSSGSTRLSIPESAWFCVEAATRRFRS